MACDGEAYDSSSGAEHHDKLLQNLKYFDLGYNMCEYIHQTSFVDI